MPTRSHDDMMVEVFQEDPAHALDLLNEMMSDGAVGEMLVTLRQMTKAFGGVQAVAEKAELNATQLYRTLSMEGNPTLTSLLAVLKAIGLQIAVRQIGNDDAALQVPKRTRKKPVHAQAGVIAKTKVAR